MKKSKYKDIVLDYLQRMPNIPHRTLTRIISQELNCIEDYDKIYKRIKYYTGTNGEKSRKELKNKTLQEVYFKRLSLPLPSSYTDYKPIKFEAAKVLVMADLHIKDHNNKALELAISYGKEKEVDTVILLGDVIDGYHISKFTQDPSKPSFNEELETCKDILQYFRQEFPEANIIYKAGNHDGLRLQNYIYRNAAKLSELEDLKLENLIKLKEYDVKYVPDMQLIKIGKLIFAHGHEFGGNPSVNIARCIYNKVLQNILFGHFHRKEEYIDVNIVTRETKGSYSIGCMSNTQPDYRPYSKYQLGFAVVEFTSNGNFSVDNKVIIEGNIV